MDRDKRVFFFAGEAATLSVVDNVLQIEEYDLELENMTMAMNGGFGDGMGTLLVAINEFVRRDEDLYVILDHLEKDRVYRNEKKSEIEFSKYMYAYFSYDSENSVRIWATKHGDFPPRIWRRLIQGPSEEVKAWALSRAENPMSLVRSFIDDNDERYRAAIVDNPHLPTEDLLTLLEDTSVWVMRAFYGRLEKGVFPEVIAAQVKLRKLNENVISLTVILEEVEGLISQHREELAKETAEEEKVKLAKFIENNTATVDKIKKDIKEVEAKLPQANAEAKKAMKQYESELGKTSSALEV